jgi:hypothetical protein
MAAHVVSLEVNQAVHLESLKQPGPLASDKGNSLGQRNLEVPENDTELELTLGATKQQPVGTVTNIEDVVLLYVGRM